MDITLIKYFFSFIISLGVTIALTPWMAHTARNVGMVDIPDQNLKNHKEPVPYLGGLAVFVGFLVGFSPFYDLDREVLAIMLGGTLIVLLGFLDDLGNLRPATKLLGQALAVLIVMKAGIAIKIVFLPPAVSYVLSFIWLMGMTNAFNIIDIMDGLSSGVGTIACVFLFIVAVSSGQTGIATMILALMGALFGFLKYNYQPAQIYLGDAGSLFIGFMLGAFGMVGIYATSNPVAVLAPVLILGVPIFDTLFVMMVRWMRGLNPLKGSPDHFALRLRRWRFTVEQTVLLSYGISILLGTAALVMIYTNESVASGVLLVVSLGLMLSAFWLWKIDMKL